jgi:twitching motility protein PilU
MKGGASRRKRQETAMDREQGIKLMQDLLRRVVDKKAADLFITAGFPPAIKIDGEVRPQSERALTAEQSAVLVRSIMNDRQTKEFDATKECNFAIAPPGIGRFRVNTFVQQGQTGCVIRLINSKIPTLEELELPPVLKEVVLSKRGLVILVGGTGSGKSTSLAAMVGYRNEKTRGHMTTTDSGAASRIDASQAASPADTGPSFRPAATAASRRRPISTRRASSCASRKRNGLASR